MEVRIGYCPVSGQLVHSGVIGEYFLNVLLANGAEIGDPASGWGGDFYAIYHNANSTMLFWEAQWDTPGDCSRFLAVFRNFLEKYFKLSFRAGQNKGRSFMAGNSEAGYFFLYQDNARLFYARTNDRGQINELISGGNYD
jgi:sarcosine oxidase delta subunit